jgi:hypothetical protein
MGTERIGLSPNVNGKASQLNTYDCMTNDPTGQAILKSLKGTPEQLKEVQNSISSIKVGAIKPN